MSTPKATPAEALLRRRAFYLGLPRETLRAAMRRSEAKPMAPAAPAKPETPAGRR